MPQGSKFGLAIAGLLVSLSGAAASAAPSETCINHALKILERDDRQGYLVYADIADKSHFTQFINCDDGKMANSLVTAVHESVHYIDVNRKTYATLGSGQVQMRTFRLPLYAPKNIASGLDSGDLYVQTYLLGDSSSSDTFYMLLEEMNAYARGMITAVNLRHFQTPNRRVGHRDGLAALMSFVSRYVTHAKQKEPASWNLLMSAQVRADLRTLWDEAEKALEAGCPHRSIGTSDGKYFRQIYATGERHVLSEILGRAVAAPKSCEYRLDPALEAKESRGWEPAGSSTTRITITTHGD